MFFQNVHYVPKSPWDVTAQKTNIKDGNLPFLGNETSLMYLMMQTMQQEVKCYEMW
jgi:hypothetical protein